MSWWIYKCNSKRKPRHVVRGDWNDYFDDPAIEWGSTRRIPQLKDLSQGDMVIAYQTDRKELVGVVKVRKAPVPHLFLKPVEEIRAKVRPLKANPKVAAIGALMSKARKTLYPMRAAEAQTLLRAARKLK